MVSAICRVFGPQMAELPLIATKNTARRQGHARILVDCFEKMIRQVRCAGRAGRAGCAVHGMRCAGGKWGAALRREGPSEPSRLPLRYAPALC